MGQWPVFICYRQIDGTETAERVFMLLGGQSVPAADPGSGGDPPMLDVYFDQAVSAAPNWKEVHRPHLEKSRAMIVVCSPGAYTDLRRDGQDDFVHEEIDWWLNNGRPAPIPVDPLGTGLKWVPRRIVDRWPDIQAIRMVEEEWAALSGDDLRALVDRTRARLIGGILPSAKTVYQQELEEEQARGRELATALARQKTTSRWLKLALYGVLVLFLGSALLGWLAYRQQQIARGLEQIAFTRLIQTYLDRGQRAVEESDDSVALLWLTEALRLNRDPTMEIRIRQRIALLLRGMPTIERILRQDIAGNVQSFDGRAFVQIEGPTARLVELKTGKEQWSIQATTGDIVDAALSPDGRYLATISDGFVELWEVNSRTPVFSPKDVWGDEGKYAVAFSPDSALLAAVSEEERRKRYQLSEDDTYELAVVQIWQTRDGAASAGFSPDVRFFRPVFSPDGGRLLTASWPLAWQWQMPGGEGIDLPMMGNGVRLKAARFSPDGLRMLGLEADGFARIRDTRSGEVIKAASQYADNERQLREPVVDGTYSADGSRIALLTEDGRIQVLSGSNLDQVAVFDVNTKKSIGDQDAVVTDGAAERVIVLRNSESAPSEIRVWDVASARPLSPLLTRPVPKLQAMGPAPDGTFIEIGGGLARWMKLSMQAPVLNLVSAVNGGVRAEPSFDRAIVDVSGDDLGVLDLTTGRVTALPVKPPGRVETVTISEDGERIAAIVSSEEGETKEHMLYVWSAASLDEVTKVTLPRNGVDHYDPYSLEFDSAGSILLARINVNLSLIRADSGKTIFAHSFSDNVDSAGISGDARFVWMRALGGCKIWDTSVTSGFSVDATNCQGGRLQIARNSSFYVDSSLQGTVQITSLVESNSSLEIHTGMASPTILISPNSDRLFVSDSSVTRIWDPATGEALSDTLIGRVAAVSPDGRLLFTLDSTLEGRIWEASDGRLLARGLWPGEGDLSGAYVAHSVFDAAGEQLRTITSVGEVMTWDLRPDQSDTTSLVSLAQLYAQRRVNPLGAVESLSAGEMVSLWSSLPAIRRLSSGLPRRNAASDAAAVPAAGAAMGGE